MCTLRFLDLLSTLSRDTATLDMSIPFIPISYGICWTSKTAWLAGVFMVVGDGGKRRQSIVSL